MADEVVTTPAETTPLAAPAAPAEAAPPALVDSTGNLLADQASEGGSAPAEGEVKPQVEEPAKPVYTDFKVPEGLELDTKVFAERAAERGLPQEAAQEFLDMHVAELTKLAEAPYKLWSDTQKVWQDAVMADPEIGGDNFAPMKATIAKAMDQYGDPGLREALILTGAGNHPAIIKSLYKMAKQLTEGGYIKGEPAKTSPEKTVAQAMWPDLPSIGNQ